MRPSELIETCSNAHERLLVEVAGLTDDELRSPSRLPDWTRAHVIAHLARNADSHTWLFEGAKRGEVRQQYPKPGMREEDIEFGSSRSKDELFNDLARSCQALEAQWGDLDDELWDWRQMFPPVSRTMAEIVFRRLREVEVHHVDLDVGYAASDWPEIYREGELHRALHGLPERTDHVALVEWLIGRGSPPNLDRW